MGKKNRNRVLALGLAGLVLASGVGVDVADAASKTGSKSVKVTAVSAKEATLKKKLEDAQKTYAKLQSDYKFLYKGLRDDLDKIQVDTVVLDKTYEFEKTNERLSQVTKDVRASYNRLFMLTETYMNHFGYEVKSKDSTAVKLKEVEKRIASIRSLNKKNGLGEIRADVDGLKKSVVSIRVASESLKKETRAKFERMGTGGYRIMNRNATWFGGLSVGIASDRFETDMKKAGKSGAEVERLAVELDNRLMSIYYPRVLQIDEALAAYEKSFNYSPTIRKYATLTTRSVDQVNAEYDRLRSGLNKIVKTAYEENGLVYTGDVFVLN